MDERELDRAIDTAAAGLINHEPSRAISYKVMSRVRQGDASAPLRFVRVAVAAGVVLCVATGVVLMYRAPQAISPLPPARPFVLGPLPTVVKPTTTSMSNTQPVRRIRTRLARTEVARTLQIVPDGSPIAPIETQPIEVALIEVTQLSRDATSIEAITIEPLTIEPLVASND